MLTYEYVGKGSPVGDHHHRAIVIMNDGEMIANALDVTDPRGRITIRVFNYLAKFEAQIRSLFTVKGVTLTFNEPIQG